MGTGLYDVRVNESFHLSGERESYTLGAFERCEDAVGSCRKVVDEFLESRATSATDAKELFEIYRDEGPEPFIAFEDPEERSCVFVAVEYAERRCAELLDDSETPRPGPRG